MLLVLPVMLLLPGFSDDINTLAELLKQARKKSPEKTQVIFTVNPDDCVNCLYNFHLQLKKLQHSSKAETTLIFRSRRAIERNRILKDDFADVDTTKTKVIWNDLLYKDALKQSALTAPGSVLLIYDKSGKIIFKKLVKEINGLEKEIADLVN